MAGPSKILDRIWRERDAAIHKRKLKEVKSNIRQQQSLPFAVANPGYRLRNGKKEIMKERKSVGNLKSNI